MGPGDVRMKETELLLLASLTFVVAASVSKADVSITELPRRLEECTPSSAMWLTDITQSEIDEFVDGELALHPQLERSGGKPTFVDCAGYLVLRVPVTAREQENGTVKQGYVNFFYWPENTKLESPRLISLPVFSFGVEFNL